MVRHTLIRVLLAMITQFDMELEQIDTKKAFLHCDLKETIYMAQPEGFKGVCKGKICMAAK